MTRIEFCRGVTRQDLSFSAGICTTGWNAALRRWRSVDCLAVLPKAEPPRVMMMRFVAPHMKLRCFRFAVPVGMDVAAPRRPTDDQLFGDNATSQTEKVHDAAVPVTRIRPPSDVIKLDDRLFYLLQPPLETLLGGASLRMPFQPFPYQLSGISFLFPRHAAILADEMGLGKTMQAITTIRLLLHAGQIRHVLLICPKPLVTNWQRQFQMWAPEIPLAVIEGDQSRRRWQWGLDDVPVKISNYEALLRDRDEVGDGRRHFDLVVLDEAQRIKNRSSSSHQVVCSISRTRSWALTGTPVENTPDDLVGIFQFLVSGYLSPGLTPWRLRDATRDYMVPGRKPSNDRSSA